MGSTNNKLKARDWEGRPRWPSASRGAPKRTVRRKFDAKRVPLHRNASAEYFRPRISAQRSAFRVCFRPNGYVFLLRAGQQELRGKRLGRRWIPHGSDMGEASCVHSLFSARRYAFCVAFPPNGSHFVLSTSIFCSTVHVLVCISCRRLRFLAPRVQTSN